MLGKEIADRIETDHLIGVVHTGDIVDSGRRTYQWENFDLCLKSFIDLIPFYPVSGNHDIGKPDSRKGGDYTGYLQQPFLKRFSEEQTFEGGKMLYAVLNEGEMPILLLGIGYDMGKNRQQLEWIDEVMRKHEDMPCILFTHAYQVRPGTMLWYCKYIENDIVAKYPNIRIVLCGHARGFFCNEAAYDDDGDGVKERTVHVLMLDEQDGEFLYRILQIHGEANRHGSDLFDRIGRTDSG